LAKVRGFTTRTLPGTAGDGVTDTRIVGLGQAGIAIYEYVISATSPAWVMPELASAQPGDPATEAIGGAWEVHLLLLLFSKLVAYALQLLPTSPFAVHQRGRWRRGCLKQSLLTARAWLRMSAVCVNPETCESAVTPSRY
jgi:hypothetical protein